jgi:mannitol/fructose-specific phosphotransferase system IIA component (Ntr-type)
MELLHKLYYDAETGFQSKEKLYKKAKEIDKKVTLELVKKFLDEQATSQITKQVTKNKVYETIVSPSIRNNYQMDIMYLPNPTLNKNFKYLLTCIDVYSRYAFVKPLKNKTGDEVLDAFKEMTKENGIPANLNVDEGTEFRYKPFKTFCEENDIELWYSDTQQENKNAIIERFHRTLRNLILAYTTSIGNSYIDALPKLIRNYNTSFHKTVKATPLQIWEGKKKNKQSVKLIPSEFSEGDKVRHIVKKTAFNKHSSTANYTKTIYTITKIIGNSIFLDDLTKPFRQHELIIAVGDDMNTDYETKASEEKRNNTIKRRLKRVGIEI